MLLNWENTDGLAPAKYKLLADLTNIMLVSLGCYLENLKEIQGNVHVLGGLFGVALGLENTNQREGRSWGKFVYNKNPMFFLATPENQKWQCKK